MDWVTALGIVAFLLVVGLVALAGALSLAVWRWLHERRRARENAERLSEFETLDDALHEEQRALAATTAELQRLGVLKKEVEAQEQELADRRKQLMSVEEAISMQEFGHYRPRYAYSMSSEYAEALAGVRARMKEMLKAGTACVCNVEWTVSGSKREGQRMTKKQVKLMLRAFNGESDAAIAKVSYSNADSMLRRIERAYEAINKLGESNKTFIQPEYLALKQSELRLVHELALKKQEEREEAREAAARLREEERTKKEIAKIQKDAEREETVKEAALRQARAELAALHGASLEKQQKQAAKLEAAVAKLEDELSEAIDRKAKAIARAQLTRSGWVYVLSNIGSFGEGVFKIGLTRRFDPLIRVKELGDASVPFLFDVHAMVFSEDAPALESALHRRFDEQRVNLVNRRKEYFRVPLDEIQEAFRELHGMVSFNLEPLAEEYWETLAILREGDDDILLGDQGPQLREEQVVELG